MDIFVREARAIVEGRIRIIRIGTCGTLRANVELGAFCIASRAVMVTSDYINGKGTYNFSEECAADEKLTELLSENIVRVSERPVYNGLNATAEYFYSTQGRTDVNFLDDNEEVLERLKTLDALSLEMESFRLFHLARICDVQINGGIEAGSVQIAIANRSLNTFIGPEKIPELEVIL
ncbi:hypothetical protein HK096_010640, partial [Nowakowskiella sp. JEL0078]